MTAVLSFRPGSSNPALPLADVHVPSFAADESFINLDFAVELGAKEFILQSKTNAVKHKPRRLLSDAHVTGDLVAADTVLAVREHPRCSQPFVQTDRAVLEDRPNLDGELTLGVMATALPSAPIRVEANLWRSATRTRHAVGPTSHRKVVNAVVGIREVDDCFLETFRFLCHLAHK